MANRYWVGGSGIWNATNTTNWSSTSGGSGGASVPTIYNDDVYFDANSGGSGTVVSVNTIGESNCASINFSGFAGNISGFGRINSSGNINVGSSGAVLGGTTGPWIQNSPNAGGTWTLTGTREFYRISAEGYNTTYNITSNMTSSWVFDVTVSGAGTINTNNYTFKRLGITLNNSSVGNLGSSNITRCTRLGNLGSGNLTGTGTITADPAEMQIFCNGTGNINVNWPTSYSGVLLYIKTGSGSLVGFPSTINCGQGIVVYSNSNFPGTVNLNSTSGSIEVGSGGVLNNVSCTATTDVYISYYQYTDGAGTITTFSSGSSTNTINLNKYTTITNLNINGPSSKTTVKSSSAGTQRTLTSTAFSLSNIAWKDINAAGTIPFTGTGFVDLGNNSNITIPPAGKGLFFGSNF